MSRQEILSWTSFTTSLSIIFFYVIVVFGWPDLLPDYEQQFFQIFFNVFWIAVIIEIIVEISKDKKGVEKDERDFLIEAHGLKNAYGFLSFAVAVILVNLFLSNLFQGQSELHSMIGGTEAIFHSLFLVLFGSNIVKRVTQLYYYRKSI